jgi:hypothetical protein
MKRLTQIFVFALVAMLLSGTALAQNEGHFYSVTTWKMQVPADGSAAELNELFKEWYEKITTKIWMQPTICRVNLLKKPGLMKTTAGHGLLNLGNILLPIQMKFYRKDLG